MNLSTLFKLTSFLCGLVIVTALLFAFGKEDAIRLIKVWEKEVREHYGGSAGLLSRETVEIDWQSFKISEENSEKWSPNVTRGYNIGEYQAIKRFAGSQKLLTSKNQDLNHLILSHLKTDSSSYPEFLAMILCDRLGIEYIPLVFKHTKMGNMWEIDDAVLKEFWTEL